jgi:hypothetical protein
MDDPFSDPDVVIFRYTRVQAIADGVLVDVSEWASPREMMGGFTIPVAVTSAVWALVQAPEDSNEDTRGRAHDVLWLASCACRANRSHFTVRIGTEDIRMWVHVGPGDDAEPVATIMLEGED